MLQCDVGYLAPTTRSRIATRFFQHLYVMYTPPTQPSLSAFHVSALFFLQESLKPCPITQHVAPEHLAFFRIPFSLARSLSVSLSLSFPFSRLKEDQAHKANSQLFAVQQLVSAPASVVAEGKPLGFFFAPRKSNKIRISRTSHPFSAIARIDPLILSVRRLLLSYCCYSIMRWAAVVIAGTCILYQ